MTLRAEPEFPTLPARPRPRPPITRGAQELQQAREEEERSDRILSLLLPPTAMEAVKNSDADSLCYGERFEVRSCGIGKPDVFGGPPRFIF